MVKFNSIKNKLILAFVVPVLFIVFLGVLSFIKASNSIRDNYEVTALKTVNSAADFLNLVISNVEAETIRIVTEENFMKYYKGQSATENEEENRFKDLSKAFAKIVVSNEFVDSLTVFSDYGKNFNSKGALSPSTYSDFIESEEGGPLLGMDKKGIWTGYHAFIDDRLSLDNELYAYTLIKPFVQGNGFVTIDIKTSKINEILEKIQFGSGSLAFFITEDGREFIDTDSKTESIYNDKFYQDLINSEEDSGYLYTKLNGKKHLLIYEKLGDSNTMVGCLIPDKMILKQASAIRNTTIIVVIITSLIAVFVGTVIVSEIGSSIKGIQNYLSRAAKGELDIDVKIKGNREFSNLSTSILGMLDNMRNSVKKTAYVSERVSESTTEVEEISKKLLESAKNINSSINDIEKGAIQQAEETMVCLLQMQNLTEKINQVEENANQIEEISNETKKIINKGIYKVDDLENKAKESRVSTEKVIEEIEQLNNATKSIGSILVFMNDIAERTNLLSLNASIEAARAGNEGKGFAVVAEEIRKLAESSVNSSKQIGKILNNIENLTSNIVITTETVKEMLLLQGESLQDTVYVFHDMSDKVEQLSGNLLTIGQEIRNVEKTKQDTLHAVETISAVSEETAAASVQVSDIANEQLKVANKLNNSSNILGEDTKNLNEAISIFKF